MNPSISPLPWRLDDSGIAILDASGCEVATIIGTATSTADDRLNTQMIVRAVNHQGALVKSVQELLSLGSFSRNGHDANMAAARAALLVSTILQESLSTV